MNARFVTKDLSGWGRHPVERCALYRPRHIDQLGEVVQRAPQQSLTARGLGRSYGDAALNRDGAVILTEKFDHLQGFDPETAVVHCEASVSLAEILATFLPRGYFFPVTPGTQFITVGGAIAADVHGKNHHRSGAMSAWVLDFRLMTAGGEILDCSRDRNADVFWATVGGMGLTGVILDARIRLQSVETAYMSIEHEQVRNLDQLLERTSATESDFAYSVAWIDCLCRGRALGRSVILRANHAGREHLPASRRAAPLDLVARHRPGVPFTLPNFALSRPSMRIFNEAYYRTHRTRQFVGDCVGYFYPLDAIQNWNRGYGSRGVVQYQCLLPEARAREGLIEILEQLSRSGLGSFLAVLKSMGPASGGLLSFPFKGQTLALDLPFAGDALLALVSNLDAIVLRHGGRVYLAKDSCLRPDAFRAMYPQVKAFGAIRAQLDPEQRFSSSLARRVGLVEPA